MVTIGTTSCPNCGGSLHFYDMTYRYVKSKDNQRKNIDIRRLRCESCGKLHRELPDNIIPYKHYERDIIEGVTKGYITSHTLGFEDYPCTLTMTRWAYLYSCGKHTSL